MQIVSLEAENIKGLRAVRIDTNGEPVIVVGGKNRAGKSSVLDSIFYALGGKDALPQKPIRNGEKKARVTLDLGDIIVERTFTEHDSKLTVKSKDGAVYKSPQAMLDALCSRLSFDPLEFCRMDAKKRAEQLRKLVGIDFTELDAKRKGLYDERTVVNRQLTAAKAKLASAAKHDDAPAEEVSLAELTDELDRRQHHNDGIEAQREYVDTLATDISNDQVKMAAIDRQIAALQRDRKALEEKVSTNTESHEKSKEELAEMKPADVDEVRQRIRTAGDTNAKVAANRTHAKLSAEVAEFESQSDALTASIAGIDAEKEGILKAAPFPVPGLGFDDNDVTYNGLPFDQCSSGESLRISAALGMKANPKFRVMRIRDGSLIDDDGFAVLENMAETEEYQLWIERVSKTAEGCTVFIEDGAVKAADVEEEEEVANVNG